MSGSGASVRTLGVSYRVFTNSKEDPDTNATVTETYVGQRM